MTERAGGRSRGLSYQALLDTDTHPVPKVLRLESPMAPGLTRIPVERYTTRAFHELEVEKVWKRAWQMACREEELPAVGDTVVYDVANLSFLVVRTAHGEIKAYYNACLHRGRRLRDAPGRVTELRCPFHGWCWKLDGTLSHIPCGWDFPDVRPADYHLPEVRVATWGGFVFVNPDPDAEPFARFIGDLDDHFDRWPLAERYKAAHVAKVMGCNWKVCQEAFMEAYHVVATHPQLLPGIADANSQYDVWETFSRAITPNGTPSPHLEWEATEQDMFDAMVDRNLEDDPIVAIPEGKTAREIAAAGRRESMRPALGAAVDALCDSEMNDSFYYTVFPNFHPWGAYNLITYRFRPFGSDHRKSIMECMYLAPFPEGQRPPPAPIHWLDEHEDWTNAPELGFLARVFNQDTFNLPKVQLGLEATAATHTTLGSYGESKIRHFHEQLDRWLARD